MRLQQWVRVLKVLVPLLDDGVHLIEADDARDSVTHLGEFDCTDDAMTFAMSDFGQHATTCEKLCGEFPTGLYRQTLAIVSRGRSERVITFRSPEPGESAFPVACVTAPATGEAFTVTAESAA